MVCDVVPVGELKLCSNRKDEGLSVRLAKAPVGSCSAS